MKAALTTLTSLALFAACAGPAPKEPTPAEEERLLESVSVLRQQRNAAVGIDADDLTAPILPDGFAEKDLLYFAQMSANVDPKFTDDGNPYVYEYRQNPEADWGEEYNFRAANARPLDWKDVRVVGSVGNAFSFYAFHFPVDNAVRFRVEADQRGGQDAPFDTERFRKSDILGAYHATSALYTRLRFRLFHLMVYLKVTLYVPVYDGETSDDYSDAHYSGFLPGAMRQSYVRNAYTDFGIEWRANRSSDTDAPLTQITNTASRRDIIMYQHDPGAEEIIEEFPVRDYYSGGTLGEDRVREYHFSVLFPEQSFGEKFLCFELTAPDNSVKRYYFSGNQIVGDSGNYNLIQGTLQHLYLYLPRKTNETILVGAKILPWADASTDMTVTQTDDKD